MPQTSVQKSLIQKAKASDWADTDIKSLEDAFAAIVPEKLTFRELVELCITIVLVVVFVFSLIYVFAQIGKTPSVYPIGSEQRVVDPFQQASSAIAIVTPYLTSFEEENIVMLDTIEKALSS